MKPGAAPLLLSLLCLAAAAAPAEPGWEPAGGSDDVQVFERVRPGAAARELLAVGEADLPPARLFRVLLDFARCTEIMPYTVEGRVLHREEGGRIVHLYTVLDAPLVARRDYALRLVDESDWREGAGFLRLSWTPSDRAPPEREGMVRVTVNEGHWLLEPLDGGRRTRVSYRLFTDPGGSLPAWAFNLANRGALPGAIEAVRRAARDPRYADPPAPEPRPQAPP